MKTDLKKIVKLPEIYSMLNIKGNAEVEINRYVQDYYIINGEVKKWEKEKIKVMSPLCDILFPENKDTSIGEYPKMNATDALKILEDAVEAYSNGNGEWAAMRVEQRIECMQKFVGIMKSKRDEIVKLLIWEIAKSVKDAEKEFDRTVDYIINTIESLKDLDRNSSRFVISHNIIAQIRRSPLGVTLCMGPYNYPLNETFTTFIPALIMGNTIVLKPPKFGVLLFAPLLEAFTIAFPKGTVNIIYGDGSELVTPIMKSGKVNVLAFIGSSKVANILKTEHPKPNRLKCVLGLDAKNPAVVLQDANLDEIVEECALGSLSYNGQRCTALKIIFVHNSIEPEFVKKFKDAVSKLTVALPWEDNVSITPMPNIEKVNYLKDIIYDAINKGAILHGKLKNEQTLFSPVVLSKVNNNMRIYHEEQFGPVVPIVSYDKIEEVLDYIIESNYGQQASIFGNNSNEIAKLVDTLVNQVSRVNINSQCQRGPDDFPFTGRKDSAEQTLSISDALRVFSIRTLVAAKDNGSNKQIIKQIIDEKKSNFLNTDFIL